MTKRSPLGVPLGLALAALALVACSSGTPGSPAPAATAPGTSGPAPSSSSAAAAAPVVAQPLNTAGFAATPCSSLTNANLVSLGVSNPSSTPDEDANGAGCSWAGDTGGALNVTWLTANAKGLSDLYAKKSTYAYWQPTQISGYPAVYGDALSDGRAKGDCVLNVGASDQLAFFVEFDDPLNAAQSCSAASKAASDVIANVKGGA